MGPSFSGEVWLKNCADLQQNPDQEREHAVLNTEARLITNAFLIFVRVLHSLSTGYEKN